MHNNATNTQTAFPSLLVNLRPVEYAVTQLQAVRRSWSHISSMGTKVRFLLVNPAQEQLHAGTDNRF
jgi:hypothetical protein